VKPVAGQIQVFGLRRNMELKQNTPDTVDLIGPDAGWIIIIPKALQRTAAEALDHSVILVAPDRTSSKT
jgi:hypothetical protein